MKRDIKLGNGVLLNVKRGHWVLATGFTDSEFLVNDPLNEIDSYSVNDIIEAAIYKRGPRRGDEEDFEIAEEYESG